MDHGWQAGPITANPGYVPGICRHPQNFEGSFRELRGNLKLAVQVEVLAGAERSSGFPSKNGRRRLLLRSEPSCADGLALATYLGTKDSP